jgi:hypothetical protein
MKVRGLTPEQLFDSLKQATYYYEPAQANRGFIDPNSPRGQFVAKFNSTERASEVQTSILQALTLMNGKFVGDLSSSHIEKGMALVGVTESPFMSMTDKIEALYLMTVSRLPRPDEIKKLIAYVDRGGVAGDQNKALADVFWALLNSSEFGFNH